MSKLGDIFSSGIGLQKLIGSKEDLVSKATSAKESVVAQYKDKVDIRQGKLDSISELSLLIRNIKQKALSLTDPLQAGFDKKTVVTSTQDTGSTADYIRNILLDNQALAGDTKVAVEQVASAAELVLALVQDTGFATGGPLNINGAIALTVGGNPRNVPIAATDTVQNIADNINQVFINNGDAFEAFLVSGNNNTAFIEVRAKNTGGGVPGTIGFNAGGTGIHNQNNPAGQDAIIHVNGVSRTQASNKFDNVVPGLSFELTGRVNSGANGAPANVAYNDLNYSTIQAKEDNSAVKSMIVDFGNTLNDLSYFIAKNKKTTPINYDQFSDPTKPIDTSENPPLYNSAILDEAQRVWSSFVTNKGTSTGGIKSIYDFGMNIQKETKEGVTFDVLYFSDENKFQKTFNDDFSKIKDFFITDTKITPAGGNASYMQYIPGIFDKVITNSSIVGKDLTFVVDFDGTPAVTGVVVLDGNNNFVANGNITHDATIGRYTIEFGNTILDGIRFSIDPRTAMNVQESYTINYTPGMANIIQNQSRDMISDDGTRGTIINQTNTIRSEITSLESKIAKQEEAIKKLTEKLNQQYDSILNLDFQAALQIAMIDSILNPDTK